MSQDELDELESEDQPTEEVENTPEVEVETPVVETEDLEKTKLIEQNKRLFERAKKAEAKLKEKPPDILNNADSLSREEAVLIAEKVDLEVIDELKDYAKLKNITLLKAKESPFGTHLIEQKEAERKKERAKLNSSKGSQVQEAQVDVGSLPRDEHKQKVKEMAEKIK